MPFYTVCEQRRLQLVVTDLQLHLPLSGQFHRSSVREFHWSVFDKSMSEWWYLCVQWFERRFMSMSADLDWNLVYPTDRPVHGGQSLPKQWYLSLDIQ